MRMAPYLINNKASYDLITASSHDALHEGSIRFRPPMELVKATCAISVYNTYMIRQDLHFMKALPNRTYILRMTYPTRYIYFANVKHMIHSPVIFYDNDH